LSRDHRSGRSGRPRCGGVVGANVRRLGRTDLPRDGFFPSGCNISPLIRQENRQNQQRKHSHRTEKDQQISIFLSPLVHSGIRIPSCSGFYLSYPHDPDKDKFPYFRKEFSANAFFGIG
jgi:hypothetical protein